MINEKIPPPLPRWHSAQMCGQVVTGGVGYPASFYHQWSGARWTSMGMTLDDGARKFGRGCKRYAIQGETSLSYCGDCGGRLPPGKYKFCGDGGQPL